MKVRFRNDHSGAVHWAWPATKMANDRWHVEGHTWAFTTGELEFLEDE